MDDAVEKSSKARKVLSFLVILFSLIFLIATTGTIVSLVRLNDFLSNAAHVDGKVVGTKAGAKGTRAPVVRFKTDTGETIELESTLYTSPAPEVGDSIRVVYRKSNPRDWLIDDWIHLYFWTLFGSVFMFSWGMAAAITKLLGDRRIRKLAAPPVVQR